MQNPAYPAEERTQPKPPGQAMTVVLMSMVAMLGVAVGAMAMGTSFWWAILFGYGAQMIFIVLMIGGFMALHKLRQTGNPRNAVEIDALNYTSSQTDPAVWLSFQPRANVDRIKDRIAVSAANDRNSKKCCQWLSEHDCEVHLCSDHDSLLADLLAAPDRWSALIVDADHIGGARSVSQEIEYLRSELRDVPIIILGNRQEKDELSDLASASKSVVLAKPFFRKTLFAALHRVTSFQVSFASVRH